MLSISVDDNLPTEFEMVMFALRPDDFSVAVTFKIPLSEISQVHFCHDNPDSLHVHFKHDFKNSIACFHRRYWS